MTISRKMTGKAMSMPAGLALGTAVSLAITIAVSALLAKLVDSESMPWENVGYCVMIMLMAAAFLGSLTASAGIRHQRLMVCLLTGAAYWVCLLAVTALFFGGMYDAVGVTGLLTLAGSGCAVLLGMGGKKGRGAKKVMRTHR